MSLNFSGGPLNFANSVAVSIPYTVFLSKNKMGYGRGKHFVLRETSAAQEAISRLILSQMRIQGKKFYPGKVWINLFIEKPVLRVDAVNFVDRISDAIQDAIGINDYMYSIACVDWIVRKNNPKINIRISQELNAPSAVCESCFQEKLIDHEFRKPGQKKINKICSMCRACQV